MRDIILFGFIKLKVKFYFILLVMSLSHFYIFSKKMNFATEYPLGAPYL